MPDQPRLIATPAAATDPEAAARRAATRERLRAYLQDPAFRAIEGFPIADDDAILALSDPPYYTACPNPFLPEILAEWRAGSSKLETGSLKLEAGNALPATSIQQPASSLQQPASSNQHYHREPFAADVSEGKNDPIYNAHSYHTKVPHKAIMRYILHYTEPGDVVFDGFCGTGMTGVAAQLCGDRKAVQSLGYFVDDDGNIFDAPPDSKSETQNPKSKIGARRAVLVDLSPAATFIAYNYNTPVDVAAFEREAQRILREVEAECSWMYETWHPHCNDPNRVKAKINYTVWSDVFVCPECGEEIIFWDVGMNFETGKVFDSFQCSNCHIELKKRDLNRAKESVYDRISGRVVEYGKQTPVLIHYQIGRSRFTKKPDKGDLELVDEITPLVISQFYPTDRIDRDIDMWYERDYRSLGIYRIDDFFTARNLRVLSILWDCIGKSDKQVVNLLKFVFTGTLQIASRMSSFRYDSRNPNRTAGGILKGALYIPSLSKEACVVDLFRRRWQFILQMLKARGELAIGNLAISTSSCKSTQLPSDSVDYIFTDPPFGSNIIYSDLSLPWETWLRVSTAVESEAVVHRRKKKNPTTLSGYQAIMVKCFGEAFRVLKAGHWITVEFHNTQNAVWNTIQEALSRAGFVIADVRTLDKGAGTFKQVTASGAVKQDLIISAYKPNDGLEERFRLTAGTPDGAWDFVRQHLGRLPVVVIRADGALEILAERQPFLLFDRMVAFHIQRGATVPLSAAAFYQGLHERFIERHGMLFLPEQVPAYDRARLEAHSIAQLTFLVSDEKTALQWLRQQLNPALGGQPQSYQQLQPQFLKQLHQAKHEALPELDALLEQNFLPDEAGLWCVPDPTKAADLETLRRKALLREFTVYLGDTKRLRQFRTEAIRAGFADAWQRKDYPPIIQVAERLPESVLQEDPELLMYYDNATLRAGAQA